MRPLGPPPSLVAITVAWLCAGCAVLPAGARSAEAARHEPLAIEWLPPPRFGALVLPLIVSPWGGPFPFPAVELNVRALRPWRTGASRSGEYGPELAMDLLSLRMTAAALSADVGAALSDRRFVFGVGFGYF